MLCHALVLAGRCSDMRLPSPFWAVQGFRSRAGYCCLILTLYQLQSYLTPALNLPYSNPQPTLYLIPIYTKRPCQKDTGTFLGAPIKTFKEAPIRTSQAVFCHFSGFRKPPKPLTPSKPNAARRAQHHLIKEYGWLSKLWSRFGSLV